MNLLWRERLLSMLAAALAVWLAFSIADGAVMLPLAAGTLALGVIFVRVTRMPIDAVAIGLLLIGYIVGNRGFAQLMPIPGFPLLPAEGGLAIAAVCMAWRCARDKMAPWRNDALNYALLAWMIVGTARFAFDFPRYGFVAMRDYVTIYYVAFFFVAQHLSLDEDVRRFLVRCLLIASACLPFAYAAFQVFPDFFHNTLTVRGIPLIYFKGDLAPAFLAIGGIILFLATPSRHRGWARVLATAMIVWVFTGDNRASMLGTVVALGFLAASRFRNIAFVQAAIVGLALMLLIGMAGILDHPWATRKVRGVAERAMSVVDVSGRFSYSYEEGSIKSDNNQFRWVWWRTVVAETMDENPALGLGFGYDLARGFLQEYNPDLAEEFTARSPHNILVTALGRMGLVGFAIFAWILVLLVVRTWRVLRNPVSDATQVALWTALWPIAISAHLGVVLEGPMGAVVFWSVLGLANSYDSSSKPESPWDKSVRPCSNRP